jgi:hypothetical protein
LAVSGFPDYEREFGGLDARSLLGYAVRHFHDNGGSQALVLRVTGIDGAAIAPTDAAFVQALNAAFATGGPVDRIGTFNLICVPGLTDVAATVMLQAQAEARRAFLIADCAVAAQAATVAASLAGKTGANAANSALFFPWLMAPDSLQHGAPRAFPPSGFVAGMFARTAREVWKAPAGNAATLVGATDLATDVTEAESGPLAAQGINCLRKSGTSVVAPSARTLAGSDAPEWKYVPVRRTALFIEQSISGGTKWAAFEPNGEALWTRLRASVDSFMDGLFRQRAFVGDTPREAWFVKCDRATTTQADIDRGVVNIVIGFAPLRPAEFVLIKIALLAGSNGPR